MFVALFIPNQDISNSDKSLSVLMISVFSRRSCFSDYRRHIGLLRLAALSLTLLRFKAYYDRRHRALCDVPGSPSIHDYLKLGDMGLASLHGINIA